MVGFFPNKIMSKYKKVQLTGKIIQKQRNLGYVRFDNIRALRVGRVEVAPRLARLYRRDVHPFQRLKDTRHDILRLLIYVEYHKEIVLETFYIFINPYHRIHILITLRT